MADSAQLLILADWLRSLRGPWTLRGPRGPDLRARLRLLRSKNFCILPWMHLSIATDGKAAPCCMVPPGQPPVGDLRTQSLRQIWNSPAMVQLRENMLQDKPSAACSKCYELEAAGVRSLRQKRNRIAPWNLSHVESLTSGVLDEFALSYLDLRFSNLCNFRCRTCGPYASSAWHADAKALGWPADRVALIRPTDTAEQLWNQVHPLLDTVEEIYFAGGEPLLMDEHYQILRELIRRRRFHVKLVYNTNFSKTQHKNTDAFEVWNQFAHVVVGASLDAMGARGEYLRAGQSWSEVIANRERMMKVCPRVEFYISPTLSLYNALHLPDFHRDWIEQGYIAPGQFRINLLINPNELSAQCLPKEKKDEVRALYRDYVGELNARFGLRARRAIGQFRSVLELMDARDQSALLPKFREVTGQLDRLRGEDFRAVFPELAELMP